MKILDIYEQIYHKKYLLLQTFITIFKSNIEDD